MSGLTLVTGGTVVATCGEPWSDPHTLAERLRTLHRRGFVFHHDPTAPRLVCYLRGSRQVPEQYYAEYTDVAMNDFDGMSEFAASLRRLEQESGWQLETGACGKQEVFDALLEGVVTDPADPGEVADLLDAAEQPIELGTPDERSAAGLYRWIRGYDDSQSVTICANGRVAELPETDVVIVPGETDRVGVPTGETRLQRVEARRAEAVEQAQSALRDALSVARSTSRSEAVARARVAGVLNRMGTGSMGLSVTPSRGRRETIQRASLWFSLGGGIGLFLAVGLVLGVNRPNASHDVLQRVIQFGVPFDRSAGSVTTWPVLVVAAGTTVSAATACLHAADLSVDSQSDRLADHAETVLSALKAIRETERGAMTKRSSSWTEWVRRGVSEAVRSGVGRGATDAEKSQADDRFTQFVSDRVFADEPFEVKSTAFSGMDGALAVTSFLSGTVVTGFLILLPAVDGVATGRYATMLCLFSVIAAAAVTTYTLRFWVRRSRR